MRVLNVSRRPRRGIAISQLRLTSQEGVSHHIVERSRFVRAKTLPQPREGSEKSGRGIVNCIYWRLVLHICSAIG